MAPDGLHLLAAFLQALENEPFDRYGMKYGELETSRRARTFLLVLETDDDPQYFWPIFSSLDLHLHSVCCCRVQGSVTVVGKQRD